MKNLNGSSPLMDTTKALNDIPIIPDDWLNIMYGYKLITS